MHYRPSDWKIGVSAGVKIPPVCTGGAIGGAQAGTGGARAGVGSRRIYTRFRYRARLSRFHIAREPLEEFHDRNALHAIFQKPFISAIKQNPPRLGIVGRKRL